MRRVSKELRISKELLQRMGLLTCMLFCFYITVPAAGAGPDDHTGIITGTVTTNDHHPAAEVTVLIKGSAKSTLSDEQGNFSFHRLAAGNYTLEISLVGYETIRQQVTVEDNKLQNTPGGTPMQNPDRC